MAVTEVKLVCFSYRIQWATLKETDDDDCHAFTLSRPAATLKPLILTISLYHEEDCNPYDSHVITYYDYDNKS